MKLRLRSLQSKETVKLEVSDQCTLQQLIEILSRSLTSSSSLASSLRFSLNRKDELSSPSPQDSLLSIGITSGDLIYFSLNPDEFSSSALAVGASSEPSFQAQAQQGNIQSRSMRLQDSESFDPNTSRKSETQVQGLSESGQTVYRASDVNLQESDLKECEISQESEVVDLNCTNQQTQSLGVSTSNEETLIQNLPQSETQEENLETQEENLETQELVGGEDMDIDTISANVDGKRISEPNFLKRVLREDIGDDFSDNKLLFIAIHAVFLESGFVGFDSVSGLRVDLFHLLQEKPLMIFTTCVSYTRPELLSDVNVTESIVLKFQTLGHYVNIYGSLAKSQSGVHKLSLNKCKFLPAIGMVWTTFDNRERLNEMDGSSLSYAESVVFEFWKTVKDQLALPLLIDLCEKTGLSLPPCLMRLPADLKFRILESLPGQYIARMACVCKEMQYLSSNNDLWNEKYAEEFGNGTGAQGSTNWKARFISYWEKKNKQKVGMIGCQLLVAHLIWDSLVQLFPEFKCGEIFHLIVILEDSVPSCCHIKIATRVTAAHYGVKLSPSFLVPSNWTGCLGVMNNYESLLPNKKALFDIPVARTASAYLTSLVLAIGAFVADGSFNGGDNALYIRPQFFYNNPLLSFIQYVIGPYTDDLGNVLPYAVQGVGIPMDPFAFVGVLGMVVTSLNLLPCGRLEGGRIAQAMFGRSTAGLLSFATSLLLGIGGISGGDYSQPFSAEEKNYLLKMRLLLWEMTDMLGVLFLACSVSSLFSLMEEELSPVHF